MHADTARTRNPMATTLTIGAAALLSLALVAAMVFTVTQAAFTDTTQNEDNSWTAGEVTLDEVNGGEAIFDAVNIYPGWAEEQTISVTNSSSVETEAFFSIEGVAGDLAQYLEIEVSSEGVVLYDGGLANVGPFADANLGTGESASYVITVSLPDSISNEAENLNATATFAWDANSVVPTP